ncbi:hypothetical protein GGR53DRAFT_523354 [Hypoxylon sp. FL1150]|nr:hypothetical protein GGR53DRAFT_523354 [Hypoxylon sp. FL1150]
MPGVTYESHRGSRDARRARPPRLRDQLAGCILWLPKKSELSSDPESDSFEEDRCNHPVVILSPQAEEGKVTYLMITSLKGMDLETRFGDNRALRSEHLPIRPSLAHPDNGMLLNLEDLTLTMRKKSYVKTRMHYRIQLRSLKNYEYNGPDYVLSRKSYQELIEYARFSPPPFHPASSTVTSPRRARSASYSEYVNSLRGLEAGLGSPPRSDSHMHYASIPNVTRSTRRLEAALPSEREPLVGVSYGYSRNPYGSSGGYPVGGHPGYTYRNAVRAGYGGLEPPKPFDWAKFWKIFKVLFCIGAAMVGFYGIMRGVQWLGGAAKDTADAIKQGIGGIGAKLSRFWSELSSNVGDIPDLSGSTESASLGSQVDGSRVFSVLEPW